MPTYTYTGIDSTGTPLDGVVEAYDEIEAMERAREICRVVRSVSEVKERKSLLSMDVTKPKVKFKNLAIVFSQFAIVLKAGLPVSKTVALVSEQTEDKHLKKVLVQVADDVAAGHGLADSLENKGGELLPRVVIETIRAGEESGFLAEGFERLQTYYDKRAKVAAKVAGAITYPIFVLIIAVVVVAVMMVMVIPAISGMVSSLGTDMPGITKFLIESSDWVANNILIIIVVFALVATGVILFLRTERGKTIAAVIQMKLPVVGPISVYSGSAQFANTMSTLIASGLPMTRAVHVTSRVISNHVLSREVGRMEAGLVEGRALGECMAECAWFPRTLVEMCAVGEQTGELEDTLDTVGLFYDSETQRLTDKALSMLEPALLVLMAGFTGFIVIALYLPLFTMYASM